METRELSVGQNNQKTVRQHHFDVLRATMLLLIVLLHVAHAYDPMRAWIVESPDDSWAAPIVSGISVFAMPGFFLISSILSIFLIAKRGHKVWAQGRLMRLGVPLIAGILLLSPLTILVASYAARIGVAGDTSSVFTGDLWTDLSGFDRRWIGHLWFLSTLSIFTLIAWFGFARGVLADWLEKVSAFLVSADQKVSVWWILVAAVGFWSFGSKASMYLLKNGLGYEPALIAVLNVDTILVYFPIYVLGLLIGTNSELRETMFKVTPVRTWILFSTLAVYTLASGVQSQEWIIIRRLIETSLGTGVSLFLLGYLADKITQPSPTVQQVSKYSYSVYLLHYPIMNWIALILVPVTLDATVEFSIAVIATYAISFLGAWMVDQIGLLRFLFNGEPFWKTAKSEPTQSMAVAK